MTTNVTHWLEYDEPTEDERVGATHRVVYETGPNEPSRDDDVTYGTLPLDALQVWEDSPHVHDDGTLLLSATDDETREYLENAFRPAGGDDA